MDVGWKQEGNAAFRAKDYAAAVRLYSLALKQHAATSDNSSADANAELAVLYTNRLSPPKALAFSSRSFFWFDVWSRSAAYGACGMALEALADADRALALVPRHVKVRAAHRLRTLCRAKQRW
jgi:tetratricopeptide (TPR) repeat protein